MWAVLVFSSAVTASWATAALPEDNQSLAFYNARLALRDGKFEDVLKWWMLRNSLWHHDHKALFDDDFRSVVWAALGAKGVCPDGFLRDAPNGAGLWPLAMYNWFLVEMSKGPPSELPVPWEAFSANLQQRRIELSDVLSNEELMAAKFSRASCWAQYYDWVEEGFTEWTHLSERQEVALLLRRLLVRALNTLSKEKVETLAAVESRLFDVDLMLAFFARQKALRELNQRKSNARASAVSSETLAAMNKENLWKENPSARSFLHHALTWKAQDWLALRPERRLMLFSMVREAAERPEEVEKVAMEVIDALVEQKKGREIEWWIGLVNPPDVLSWRMQMSEGERGKRLLELDDESGFRERGPVALQRGVWFLQKGERQEALRSFALALKYAPESKDGSTTLSLARRWLSYVLSRYQTDEEVIATLRALVPRQDFNGVAEDLAWGAALRADLKSFEALSKSTYSGSSLDARIRQLRTLAMGQTGKWVTEIRDGMENQSYFLMRFLKQWLEKIETEEVAVRQRHVPTLRLLSENVMKGLLKGDGKRAPHARAAEEWLSRAQAVLGGVQELEDSVSARARALSPEQEVLAGTLRLAPADTLPWPFPKVEVQTPTIFVPFKFIPVEWISSNSQWVMGWSITE